MDAADYASAAPAFEEVTRAEEKNWRAFSRLGFCLAKQGHYETAIGAFRRATEINPRSSKLHYNLGQAYELAGVPEEAMHEYDEALTVAPGYQLAEDGWKRVKQALDNQVADQQEQP